MNPTNRRTFLRQSAAIAATGYWFTASARSAERTANGPNSKLLVACIGVGGRGADNVAGVSGETLVAFADVDDARAAGTYKKYPTVPHFQDFRVMLDKVKPIDAIVVSTPDHTHAVAAMAGIRRGKHVYCEKPLAHSIAEARMMTTEAAKAGVATQMGHQLHSEFNYRRAVELVRDGVIGTVREAHAWCGKAFHAGKKPTEKPPVPATLNWDLWVGPAQMQPYSPKYVPFNWRAYRDFGTGGLGDMGCHIVDPIATALDLRAPTKVVAKGSDLEEEGFSSWLMAEYEFPARDLLPPLKLTWYHGDRRPPAELGDGKAYPGAGCLFVGDKGRLLVTHGGSHKLLPEDKFPGNGPPTKLPKHPGHHQEWINACKTGSPTGSNFGYAGPLTETILMGNIAHRVGKPLTWDAPNMKFIDCPEANALLQTEYRAGWTL